MNSEQSSFRDIYGYPQQGHEQRQGIYTAKKSRRHKGTEIHKQTKESFYNIVQKAKNVAMFTQTLKQKIAGKRTLNMHTLKLGEMAFLENDSQVEQTQIYFQHDHRFILVFEVVFIAVMLLHMWKSTFEIVFGNSFEHELITMMALFVYLTHALLFNLTEYKNQKFEIISNRNEIQQLYIKKKLPNDIVFLLVIVLQITPLDSINSCTWLFVLTRIVSLISYCELSETCEKVENLLCVSNQAEISIAIFKLLFKVVLFLHFLSIALNLLAEVESSYVSETWLTDNNLSYSSNFEKYIIGWYWGATILSTVGFGDITPKNNYQRFFISIVQIICCMTIGYFVNVIGMLIKMRAESQEKYEKQVRSLNRSLNFLSTSNDLKHKIRTHYFNRHMIEKIHDPKEEKQLMQNLTPNLQKILQEENNISILKKNSIMQKFKEESLLKLAHLMKKIILAPEHIVYSRQSVDRKLWFIENGIIQEFTDNFENSKLRKTIFSYNEKDSVVGWINFLTQTAYRTTTKAKIFTIAYELDEEGFLATLKENTGEYHKFMHMKHEMMLKNRRFVHKCISCDRYTHNVINCPRIHFVRKDIKKLAQQYQHLHNFIDVQHKVKKYKRLTLRQNWKLHFGNNQLENQINTFMNNDSIRVSNGNIENLFKNICFRNSIIGFQKKKMSFLVSKKERVESFETREIKDNNRESYDKSVISCDEVNEMTEELIFDHVFFNRENNDYMPEHDVEKVITLYGNRLTRKIGFSDKVKRFMQKEK